MKNITANIHKHNCLMMEFDVFKELIEKLTNDFKTVEYEFGNAYITETINAKISNAHDDRTTIDILSEYFDIDVTSWHSDTNEECPCIWIVYKKN